MFKIITAEGNSGKFQRQIVTDAVGMHGNCYSLYPASISQMTNILSPVHLGGYLQLYKYCSECYDDIKWQFTLTDDIQDEVRKTMVRMVLEHLLAEN